MKFLWEQIAQVTTAEHRGPLQCICNALPEIFHISPILKQQHATITHFSSLNTNAYISKALKDMTNLKRFKNRKTKSKNENKLSF